MSDAATSAEIEAHIRKAIRYWTWSGYYDAAAAKEMLPDVLEEGIDADAMYALIPEAFAEKARAEQHWPERTDCDRIDAAFAALDASGVCALQNTGFTMSDGLSDVRDAAQARGAKRFQGYCFFHGQDVEHALDGHGLHVAFGAFERASAVQIGQRVVRALQDAGLAVSWDGEARNRICLPAIEWKRRA